MLSLMYHIPVLLHASVAGLDLRPGGTYVDATFGGGGHSRYILERLGPDGSLYAFDQDPDAVANVPMDSRFHFIPQNFGTLAEALQGVEVDGILADLGISSHQVDEGQRGFSYRAEAPLDMRMSQDGQSAADLINTAEETELADILYYYGEFRQSRAMARALVQARPMHTTGQLVQAVRHLLPRHNEYADLSRLFQAFRIAVNNEMDVLKDLLEGSLKVLRPGGRISIISYHSLEDRLVKHYLRSGREDGELQKDAWGNPLSPWKLVTRKPIIPTEEEIALNPRARSAKLRIAEKI